MKLKNIIYEKLIHYEFFCRLMWWFWKCDLCHEHPYRSKIYPGLQWHKGEGLKICPRCAHYLDKKWIIPSEKSEEGFNFWKYEVVDKDYAIEILQNSKKITH